MPRKVWPTSEETVAALILVVEKIERKEMVARVMGEMRGRREGEIIIVGAFTQVEKGR